jgi:hypothetical protein
VVPSRLVLAIRLRVWEAQIPIGMFHL